MPPPAAEAPLAVPLARALTPRGYAHVVAELIKYVLHARGQLPAPYAVLKRSAELDAPTKKTLAVIDGLCAALTPALLANSLSVHLVLGNTPTSAHEVYTVQAHARDDDAPSTTEQEHQTARQALRALLNHENALAEAAIEAGGPPQPPSLPPTALHVLVATHATAHATAPADFLPKRGYRLPSAPRTRVLNVVLGDAAPTPSNSAAMFFLYKEKVPSVVVS